MRALRISSGVVRWLLAGSMVVLALSWVLIGMSSGPTGLSAEERASLARQFAAARVVSPIEQYELTAKYDREHATSVARCMREARWRYVAYVPDAPQPPGFGLAPERYAQQYGFGISTTVDHVADVVPDADPNVEIRKRLTEDELTAYRGTHRRCVTAANQSIPLPPGTMVTSTAANDALKKVQRQVDSDPRVQAAISEWSRCMTAAGFPTDRPEDLRHQVQQRLKPLRPQIDDTGAASSHRTTDQTLPLDEARRLELSELQSFERAAASADWHCGASLRPLTEQIYAEKVNQLLATD